MSWCENDLEGNVEHALEHMLTSESELLFYNDFLLGEDSEAISLISWTSLFLGLLLSYLLVKSREHLPKTPFPSA